jgi:hypothetical protein
MFCDYYGGRLVPEWQRVTPLTDDRGHWVWVDKEDNLMVIHTTGIPKDGRSKPISSDCSEARFRLGSAWDDARDNQYVTIPRMQDTLVVIRPEGKWQKFPLGEGLAAKFYRAQLHQRSSNMLQDAGALLDKEAREKFNDFLKGYVAPEPPKQDE